MTVQKRVPPPTRDAEDQPLFDIPPALLAELEAMNKRVEQHEMPEEQIDVDPTDYDDLPAEQPETDVLADYRVEVLGKAAHIVTQDRNIQYGAPEDSFLVIAEMWNAYLGGADLLPTDVAAMLALLKIARLARNPTNEDSWIDLAGYAACGASAAKDLVPDVDTAE